MADSPIQRSAGSDSVGSDGRIIELLALRAWTFRRLPESPFSMPLTDLDPQFLLEAIYAHARNWAPGLDVPYAVPRLIFRPQGLGPTGTFSVSEDGWTTIEVCSSLRDRSFSIGRVLAHEVCHHILFHAGLEVRGDDQLNERRTELAMFVCGLGRVAIAGDREMAVTGQRADPSLGYMTHQGMLSAEHDVLKRIARMDGESVRESALGAVRAEARRLFHEPGQYSRMLAGYRRLYPQSSEHELHCRRIEEYQRDRR